MNYFWNQSEFLTQYWQKKPWHGKAQLQVKDLDVAPEDLDYLCEQSEVTSRLLVNDNDGFALNEPRWDDSDQRKRTLFIQEMDVWFPEVRGLLEVFERFPRWRMDDVMGSYSTAGSSSSPHVDFYDVFIIQVSGSKLWRIEEQKRTLDQCKNQALLPNEDLRIIKKMQSSQAFLLEAGDVLYVPTRFVHEAIAQTDSFSFSVGLRSPRIKDMVACFDKRQAASIDEDLRMEEIHVYPDAWQIPTDLLGHILNWPEGIDRPVGPTPEWFGKMVTQSDEAGDIEPLEKIETEEHRRLYECLADDQVMWILHHPFGLAWQQRPEQSTHALFIQGTCIDMPKDAVVDIEHWALKPPTTSKELKVRFEKCPWIESFWLFLCTNQWMEAEMDV